MQSMMDALRKLRIPRVPALASSFSQRAADPLTHVWRDGNGRVVRLN